MPPSREDLQEYLQYSPGDAAALLGVAPSTYLLWRKKYGLKVFPPGGPRRAKGELPGSLVQSIRARGAESVRDMSAVEIGVEFGVSPTHVRWAAKRFGFEYRAEKRGRKAEI